MTEVETPFRPREKLIEKQRYFQNIHKHTYLKGPFDKVTSVAIPIALAATSLFMIPGYERLCCLSCIQPKDHNFGTTCVCLVPKDLREVKDIECVHCGCRGCASGD